MIWYFWGPTLAPAKSDFPLHKARYPNNRFGDRIGPQLTGLLNLMKGEMLAGADGSHTQARSLQSGGPKTRQA
jgi:hypothetical protein